MANPQKTNGTGGGNLGGGSGSYARGKEKNRHQPDGPYLQGGGAPGPDGVLGFGARYRLHPRVEIVAQMNNALDTRYDTAYRELRQVSWDAYIDVRGRRYSIPALLAGRTVQIRLTLDGELAVYDGEQLVATHRVVAGDRSWATVPAHHAALWAQTLAVEQRTLAVDEEVTS